jgi:hypothetical protein
MLCYWRGLAPITSSTTPFTGLRLLLRASLLKGPRSHSSNNALIISFQLVLYVTERASLPYFQYNSVYWFTTGIPASLLKAPRSHTSSNALITSYRLVSYVTEGVLIRYFQYNSVYWFTTGIHASLLKRPRSHISSTTPFYWFTTGITCKFAEGASLPYF